MNAESIYNLTMLMNNYAIFQSVIQKGCSESDINDAIAHSQIETQHYDMHQISGLLTQKDADGAFFPDEEKIRLLIADLLHDWFPHYTIVPIEEYEKVSQGKTYKNLYEELRENQRHLDEDIHNANTFAHEKEQEVSYLNSELKNLKEKSENFKASSDSLLEFISHLINGEITVSIDTDPHDKLRDHFKEDVSTKPGVYEGKRPSWFTELNEELSQLNEAKKNARETVGSLRSLFHFWEGMDKKKDISVEKRADEVDEKRRRKVIEILSSTDSNEVKYLKYMLITPGIPSDYLKTLNGCADMGIDANVIIQLLERPADSFNKEIIEAYVSRAHKGVAYDYKQKLAEELLMGNWYVTAKVNGKQTKHQLVPWDDILAVKTRLEEIAEILTTKSINDDVSDYVTNEAEKNSGEQEEARREDIDMGEAVTQYAGGYDEVSEVFAQELIKNDPSLSAVERDTY